jgi:hypothetical protein
MYLTLGIGTLLLGGWVLPDMAAPTASTAPAGDAGVSSGMDPSRSGPELMRPSERSSAGGMYRPGSSPMGHGGAAPYGGPSGGLMQPMSPRAGAMMSPTALSRQFMPASPTDPNAALPDIGRAAMSPTASPTASSRAASRSRGRGANPYAPGSPAARAYSRSRGLSPTASASRGSDDRREASETALRRAMENVQQSGISAGGSAGFQDTKPFSGYRQPQAVSPYLNLFRRDAGDDFDNYNTLVRPMVEQERFNSRVRQEVRGLEDFSKRQRAAMQQIERSRDSVYPGATDPRFFQNTQGFYPGR